MSRADDQLLDLVAAVYDAALATELWPRVAAEAGRALGSAQVMMGVVDRSGRQWIHASSHDLGQRLLSGYLRPENNPGLAFSALTAPTTVELREKLVSDRDLERSEFYQSLLRPLDLWHVAIVNVHRDESMLAPMGFLRTHKERPFGESELLSLRRLAPHLNRALRVTLRLMEMGARADSSAEIGERALTAIVVPDAFGLVAEANSLARVILEEADGLLIRDGVLRGARSDDNARLVRLILEAAGGVDGLTFIHKSGAMQVARPSCHCRSSSRRPATPPRPSAVRTRSQSPLPTQSGRRKPTRTCSSALYGFTAREAAVAALLLQGCSPAEAAAELTMTENTVRTHIRHAFEKTGVKRLSDFVRLLMQGPGVRAR